MVNDDEPGRVIYAQDYSEVRNALVALRVNSTGGEPVLPGKKAATFFQLDRRLDLIIDLQLFSQIPC